MSLQRRCYKHKKGTVREVSWSGQMTWAVFPRTGQRRRGQWAGTVKEGLEPKHWFPPPELEYRVDDSSAVPGTSWVHFLLQVILSILLHPEGWAKGFTARFLAPSWLHATLRYDHKLHHFPSMEKAGEINHYPLWELQKEELLHVCSVPGIELDTFLGVILFLPLTALLHLWQMLLGIYSIHIHLLCNTIPNLFTVAKCPLTLHNSDSRAAESDCMEKRWPVGSHWKQTRDLWGSFGGFSFFFPFLSPSCLECRVQWEAQQPSCDHEETKKTKASHWGSRNRTKEATFLASRTLSKMLTSGIPETWDTWKKKALLG